MRHSEICTLLLCPPAPLESLFSNRFVVFPTPLCCRLCFCASSSWHPTGGICPGSFTLPLLQGEFELCSCLPSEPGEGLEYAVVNEQLGRSLGWICAVVSRGNSDLSYSEDIFKTFKLCFPKVCTIFCFSLWGSVGLFGGSGFWRFFPP